MLPPDILVHDVLNSVYISYCQVMQLPVQQSSEWAILLFATDASYLYAIYNVMRC